MPHLRTLLLFVGMLLAVLPVGAQDFGNIGTHLIMAQAGIQPQ